MVRNVNGTVNVGGAITHQIECSIFLKRHIERVQMDMYNLKKKKVILDIPWLATYNPEIDWEKKEVKIMWCLPICRKRKQEIQEKRQVRKIEKGKTIEELVSKRF